MCMGRFQSGSWKKEKKKKKTSKEPQTQAGKLVTTCKAPVFSGHFGLVFPPYGCPLSPQQVPVGHPWAHWRWEKGKVENLLGLWNSLTHCPLQPSLERHGCSEDRFRFFPKELGVLSSSQGKWHSFSSAFSLDEIWSQGVNSYSIPSPACDTFYVLESFGYLSLLVCLLFVVSSQLIVCFILWLWELCVVTCITLLIYCLEKEPRQD